MKYSIHLPTAINSKMKHQKILDQIIEEIGSDTLHQWIEEGERTANYNVNVGRVEPKHKEDEIMCYVLHKFKGYLESRDASRNAGGFC